jgi:hypothetical protein
MQQVADLKQIGVLGEKLRHREFRSRDAGVRANSRECRISRQIFADSTQICRYGELAIRINPRQAFEFKRFLIFSDHLPDGTTIAFGHRRSGRYFDGSRA